MEQLLVARADLALRRIRLTLRRETLMAQRDDLAVRLVGIGPAIDTTADAHNEAAEAAGTSRRAADSRAARKPPTRTADTFAPGTALPRKKLVHRKQALRLL